MILFITHEASLTGAPILLRDFLIYLKESTSISFEIAALAGGDLLPDFQKIAPTQIWDLIEHPPTTFKQNVVYGVKKTLGTYETQIDRFVKYVRQKNIRLIYSNTIVNGDFLDKIRDKVPDVQIIVHVHELENVIQIFDKMGKVQGSLKHAHHFVACSEAVRQNLIKNHAIKPQKIDVVHEFRKFHASKKNNTIPLASKIPENATVVMGCGTFDWRKGSDLFIQIAKKLASENLHFIWLGGDPVQQQLFRAELADKQDFIHLIPRVSNPRDYYEIATIFLMLSREDPFPLVNLEAGLAKLPIICYQNSGGTQELITKNTGFVTPLGNTEIVAQKIIFLHENPKITKEMGEKLHNRILAEFSWEISAQKLVDVIQKFYELNKPKKFS